MLRITVSYRRSDSDAITGRIFDRLVAHFGKNTVFRDIDDIPPGTDFRKFINMVLETTDVLLAVIGPQWLGRTWYGHLRIKDQADLVRTEIATALRNDITVIPILVGNAVMPNLNDLPEDLQDFPFLHAVKVDSLEDFDDHVRRLIRSLDGLLAAKRYRLSQGYAR